VGLDRGRGGSAPDRLSDHRRLEQQHQHREQRIVADGNDQQHACSTEHDRLRLDFAEAGDPCGADGSGPRSFAGRRKITGII